MIEIKEITKAFDDKVLFENYSLTVNDGEFIVFTGKSGCGKSTILNIIGGLEKPDKGFVTVNNINIYKKKNQKKYFSDGVCFLFQNFALIEGKTVRENLKIIPKKCREDITIEEILTNVDLKDKIDTKVFKLSGGEQQRVALARVMLKRCSIILADEPTGSLDMENANIVLSMLLELSKKGKTVVLVTHNMNIIPKNGRVIKL